MLKVVPLHAFNDNYIWAIQSHAGSRLWVVDPGDPNVVLTYCEEQGLSLKGILITHHHPDHTGGVAKLVEQFDCPVLGFKDARFKGITKAYAQGDDFELDNTRFEVIEVPGHTLDHIAFFSPAQDTHEIPWLFCGDTLFSGGCGRLFEGSPAQMHASLGRLSALPDTTNIYCAHEYTLSNLAFARTVEPGNTALLDHIGDCEQKRADNQPTIPTRLGLEKDINPFLRANASEVIAFAKERMGTDTNITVSEVDVFAEVRKAKDQF